MKYNKRIAAAILMTALLPVTHAYAAPGKNINKQKGRPVPELFDNYGMAQSANKAFSAKAVKGRNRSVTVNTDLFWSDELTLTLFDDVVVTVVQDRIIDKIKGSTTWIGHVKGELDSEVFLTLRGRSMSGTVRIGEELYEISMGPNDVHEITKVNPGNNPIFEDDAKSVEDFHAEGGEIDSTVTAEPLAAYAETNAGTYIDVMVLYTPQARANASGQSGIEAKIVNALAKANQAYINSEVDMQVNLVHMAEINYSETGTMSTSLKDITGTSDGKMDEAHALRNQYGADQVVLITTDTSACGTGYLMSNPSTSFASYAFSVVHDDSKYSCLSNHTLAHELGHNQGDHHDSGSANSSGAYDYSYGYRLCESGGFRTVMSYNCSGATRVGYFSNPDVIYNGEYTGTNSADNARSMTNTKAIVAAFRGAVETATAPASPSSLNSLALSDTEIAVSWADNSDNETGFRLERSTSTSSWAEIARVGNNVRNFNDTGLVAETTYSYRVRAYNSNGNSGYSNTGSATTDNLVVVTCENNTPSLSIAPNTLFSKPGASVSFKISLTNQDSSVCNATSFTLTTSDGGTLGSYTLSSGSSANTSWSTTAPLTDGSHTKSVTASASGHNTKVVFTKIIVDGTAPSAPGNLTAAVKRKSQVGISWSASSDFGSGFDRYVVKRNGITIANTTSTSYTDKPGSGTHTYAVSAYDKAGNSTQGNSTSVTVGSSKFSGGTKGKGRKK